MKTIFNSPILQFLILGGLLFIVYTKVKPGSKETIRVTQQTVDALVQGQLELVNRELTPEEIDELILGHIEDEVLLREAYKRGVDKNDGRVRRRVLPPRLGQ